MRKRRDFIKVPCRILPALLFFVLMIIACTREPKQVLIIGDSISIGYGPFVKELLAEEAVVTRPMKDDGSPENCSGTTNGVQHIDRWLGETAWDLIHFNFGLHDIKHVDPETGAASKNPADPVQADPDQYGKNLEIIVEKLKASGAQLVFATTTPYPDEKSGPLRDPGMPAIYNEVAIKIMHEHGIPVNDLHAFVLPRMSELQRPQNVHFTEEGSKALAEQVARVIRENLP